MLTWPTLLLVGSAQRDNGKTRFACDVIRRVSRRTPVLGLKVTVIRGVESACPRGGAGCGVCGQVRQGYELSREHLADDRKDTRRMVAAGASEVWWLRVREDAVEEGIQALWREVDVTRPAVGESNSLRRALVPGLFVMIQDPGRRGWKETAKEVAGLADLRVSTDGERHHPDPGVVDFVDGTWKGGVSVWRGPAGVDPASAFPTLPGMEGGSGHAVSAG